MINGITLLNNVNNADWQFKLGQHLQVEVLNANNSEGLISVGGKQLPAKLDVNVKPGDRFWVAVKDINNNEILLAREQISPILAQKIGKENFSLLLSRGLPFIPEIALYLNKFRNFENNSIQSIIKGFESANSDEADNKILLFLKDIIPKLDKNGQNELSKNIMNYFKKSGISYEHKVFNAILNLDSKLASEEVESSLKGQLLNSLNTKEAKNNFLVDLLEQITGQQLWIQTGAKENACFLLHIPVQFDSEIYETIIAGESSRKQGKVDLNHCHLAIQVETLILGKIGVELCIHEKDVMLFVLYDEIEAIKEYINSLFEETKDRFDTLGLSIKYITVKPLSGNKQFQKLIHGDFSNKVDVLG